MYKRQGWYASQEKGRVYFVQIDNEIKSSSVKTETPKAFSYENTSTLELDGRQNVAEDGTPVSYTHLDVYKRQEIHCH